MRKALLTIAAAAAIGAAALAGAAAAPNVAPLGQASSAVDNVTKVWHCRYWSYGRACGGPWRWDPRGGCRRCNPWRCWWVC
jgi:hypothetical protein